MGLTYVDATVTGPTDKSRQIQLLVDSGASYSLLPEDVWQELEIKPQEKLDFIHASMAKSATPPSSSANPATNHSSASSPWKTWE
jgi:predicted aspartyl protease